MTLHGNAVWGDDQDKILVQMWDEGCSASVIASRIGAKSRSAVLGRLSRLKDKGIQLKERIKAPAKRPRRSRAAGTSTAPRSVHRLPKPPRQLAPRMEALPPPTVIVKAGEVEPNGAPVGLIELCSAACRWPVTSERPHKFCNKIRRGDSSYCDEHARKSFAPRTDRRFLSPVDSAHKVNSFR